MTHGRASASHRLAPPTRNGRPSVQFHPVIVCNFKPVVTVGSLRPGGEFLRERIHAWQGFSVC